MGCRNYPGLRKFLVLLVGMCVIVWCGWVLTMLKPFNQRKLWNSAQLLILGLHRTFISLDKTLCLLPWSNNFLFQMLRRLMWQPCDSSLYWPAGLSGCNKRKSEFKKRTVITLTVHITVLSQEWQCRVKGSSTVQILCHNVHETNKDSCQSMVVWNKYWLSFYFVTKAVLREAASIWMFTGAQRCLLFFFKCFQKSKSWCTPKGRCSFEILPRTDSEKK